MARAMGKRPGYRVTAFSTFAEPLVEIEGVRYVRIDTMDDFGEPDAVIYNAGQFPANRHTPGMTSKTSVDLSKRARW